MSENLIYTRIIASGNLIEEFTYEYPIVCKKTSHGGRKHFHEQASTKEEEHRKVSVKRAVTRLKRLLSANFRAKYNFITLTFSDDCSINVQNLQECKKEFDKFKKRVCRFLTKNGHNSNFKYIGVTEFQDAHNREAIHFHLVTDLPFIPQEKLQALWQNGGVWVKNCRSSVSTNHKISHYLSKGILDSRLNGHQRYMRSHNLVEPKVLYGREAEEFLAQTGIKNSQPEHSECYINNYQGKTVYRAYFIPNKIRRSQQ
ncbi:hypothetical protein PP175_01530 [Aneurinibacillus sp. Ricciae_BoGa-3]|uniref:rolling circle replication-associated protein n=1 Tax=Aneurinibacillus sp. Ricciae_BoGa-3 TaxID=3022697 RepID=UPI002340B706|nr:hypothetical protein [Aneurinibacillus sp. Ricciae_BoGa-3]WCK54746.1 hypothetical protein PP175_01530 [Aneurinibacillus sp. Ricciae_BoGa-3]